MDLGRPYPTNASIEMLSADDLVRVLQAQKEVLLIDCRSFMEYHTSNIKTSINIGGNRLVRRRLQQAKVTVGELIAKRLEHSPKWRRLQQASVSVVVYDQCTDDVSNLQPECFAYLIVQHLRKTYRDVKLLKGGFLAFQARFPMHCWENKGKFADEDFVGGNEEEADSSPVPKAMDEVDGREMSRAPLRGVEVRAVPCKRGSLGSVVGFREATPEPRLRERASPRCAIAAASVSSDGKWHSLSGPALPVSNPGPTQVLYHLYLGSRQDAMSTSVLRSHGITHVLNVSVDCPPPPPYISRKRFLRIPVNDNYSDRIIPHMQKAFEFLNEARDSKGRALVHCSAGISRSPTVAIAYIMHLKKTRMKEAYDFVKSKRTSVSPNFNFLGQLLEFERHLQTCATLKSPTSAAGALVPSQSLIQPSTTSLVSSAPKKRERPTSLVFAAPTSSTTRSLTSPRLETGHGDTGFALSAGKRSRVCDLSSPNLLPSPSTHFSQLQLSSPSDDRRSISSGGRSPIIEYSAAGGGRASVLSFGNTRSVRSPVGFPNVRRSSLSTLTPEDPLSRFPTTNLSQLHFEPCSTAGVRRSQSTTFPRYNPPSLRIEDRLTASAEVPPSSLCDLVNKKNSSSLVTPTAATPTSEDPTYLADLIRRSRSYEDIVASGGQAVAIVLSAATKDDSSKTSGSWTRLNESSCRQVVECHQSTSSISSSNSHNSNHGSYHGIYQVS